MQDGQTGLGYPRAAVRRVFYGLLGIAIVMIVGIIGFQKIEGMNLVNAIYFESMIATGQGPPFTLNTDAGKIFASIMAFVSVSSVITTLFFTLAPVFAQIWREVALRGEAEARRIEVEAKKIEKDVSRKGNQDDGANEA